MDTATAKRLRKRAVRSAEEKGFYNDSEDIAQDVILNYLKGKGAKQTVDQAVIDEIRRRYGRNKESIRKNGTIRPIPKRNKIKMVSAEPLKYQPSDSVVGSSISDFEKAIKDLPPVERGVLNLMCIWGMTPREISFIFGVTPSYVYKLCDKFIAKMNEGEEDKIA